MPQTIRVRAVEGAVVFAVDPTTGRTSTPLRAIGREGPSALSAAMPHEDVVASPAVIRAIASGDLVVVEERDETAEEVAAPVTDAPASADELTTDASEAAAPEPEKENG
jgi:hypothetical protein